MSDYIFDHTDFSTLDLETELSNGIKFIINDYTIGLEQDENEWVMTVTHPTQDTQTASWTAVEGFSIRNSDGHLIASVDGGTTIDLGVVRTMTSEEAQAIRDAEALRVIAETSRTSAENIRVLSEESRIENETDRSDAETTRLASESARVNSEAGRVNAEASRAVAESQRVSEWSGLKTEAQEIISDADEAITGAETVNAVVEKDGSVSTFVVTDRDGIEHIVEIHDGPTDWDDITNKPEEFPPEEHTHSIEEVEGLAEIIPDQASEDNQLADKAFVNSSIATSTAIFRGTYNTLAELEAQEADINDYGFVRTTDSAGNVLFNRYKYNGTSWVYEYTLNNSSFTSEQWAAINSGATSVDISKIATHTSQISALQTGKQDKIPNLSSYVKNTDYASASVGGAVKINGSYRTKISASGVVYCETIGLDAYKNGLNEQFIGKGTLENIASDLIARTGTSKVNVVQGSENVGKILGVNDAGRVAPVDISEKIENVVKYIPQELTDEEKAQARENIGATTGTRPAMEKVNDYLYRVSYGPLDYEFATKWFEEREAQNDISYSPSGCTVLRLNNNTIIRNFDWVYNNNVSFGVSTTDAYSFQTVGMSGAVPGLDKSFVESMENSELYDILPFFIVDGQNSEGLYCSSNVVPLDYGENEYVPSGSEYKRICGLMLVRYILDNFFSVDEVVENLGDLVSVWFPTALHKIGYEMHYCIADKDKTYCLEFVDNEMHFIDISDNPVLTNFYLYGVTLNEDKTVYTPLDTSDERGSARDNGITEYGSGLERWNIAIDIVEESKTHRYGPFDLAERLWFAKNAYDREKDDHAWDTEFVGGVYSCWDTHEHFQAARAEAYTRYESRTRDDPPEKQTWQTVHTSVYSLDPPFVGCIECQVASQESLSGMHTIDQDVWPTAWDIVMRKPDTFPPEEHTHDISDVNGLQEALDNAGVKHIDITDADELYDLPSGIYYPEQEIVFQNSPDSQYSIPPKCVFNFYIDEESRFALVLDGETKIYKETPDDEYWVTDGIPTASIVHAWLQPIREDVEELSDHIPIIADEAPSGAKNVLFVDTSDDATDPAVRWDIDQSNVLSTADKTRARANIGAADAATVAQQSEAIATLTSGKVDKNQGAANAGKLLSVGENGNILLTDKEVFIAEYNVTSYADLTQAINAGKVVFVKNAGSSNEFLPYQKTAGGVHYFYGNFDNQLLYCSCSSSRWYYSTNSVELTQRRVTSISASSTDTQYPSAKAVFDNTVAGVQIAGTELTKDSDGKVNVPIAESGTLGVVKVAGSTSYGIQKFLYGDDNGLLHTVSATDLDIDRKTNQYQLITPYNLDYAIRAGLLSNSQITDADKPSIQSTLGIVTCTQAEYDAIAIKGANTIYMIVEAST